MMTLKDKGILSFLNSYNFRSLFLSFSHSITKSSPLIPLNANLWTFSLRLKPNVTYIWQAIKKRDHEPMYKTNTKNEENRLRLTFFAIAKLEEQHLCREQQRKVQYCYQNKIFFMNQKKCWGGGIIIIFFNYTVRENISATIKMRNNFCYPLKMIIFQIF